MKSSFRRLTRLDFHKVMGILGLISITALFGFVVTKSRVVQASPLPKALKECLEPYENPTMLSRVQTSDKTIFLIRTGVDSHTAFDVLITLSQGVCSVENGKRGDADKPLAAYLPQEIANQLAHERLTWIVKKEGGKKAYQEGLNQLAAHADNMSLFMPEEIHHALVSQGFTIPSNIVVSNDPPKLKQAISDRH